MEGEGEVPYVFMPRISTRVNNTSGGRGPTPLSRFYKAGQYENMVVQAPDPLVATDQGTYGTSNA